jgi:hypothetical protein
MTEHVTALYRASANAEAFMRALAEHGYKLARGDRRDFCILDNAGHVHSLARRIDAISAGRLAKFMESIEPASLPTLEQACRNEL